MNVHLSNIPDWLLLTFYGGVTLAAFLLGSWRARLVAGSLAADALLQFVGCQFIVCVSEHQYVVPWRYVLEDTVLLSILLICAARARRYWTIWAASVQTACIVTDLLYIALKPVVGGWAYASASRIWALLIFSLVLWDVVLETRARRAAAQAVAISP